MAVTAGQVTRAPTVSYDRAGSARITWDVPVGFAPAATMGATLRFTGWSEGFLPFPDCSAVGTAPKGCLSGSPRTAGRLFPGNYAVWGGRCATAPAAPTTATVTGGQPVDLTVKLAPVTATLKSNTGVVLPNRALYLIAVTGTACSESYSVTSDASGVVRTSLPSGTWRLSLTADGSAPPVGGWPTVALDAYGAAAAPQTVSAP